MGKYTGKTCRLLCMLTLTGSFFLVEIIVGYITNSLALVGDSYHMLSDVVALLVGFASVRIAKWPRDIQKNTFGWARAEVLGALVNSVFLIALCFTIFVEALQRMFHDEHIHDPDLMLIVGVVGLAVNLIGLFLFQGHGHSHGHGHGHSHDKHGHDRSTTEEKTHLKNGNDLNDERNGSLTIEQGVSDLSDDTVGPKIRSSAQLNMKGVFLHVLGDALGSVVVIISALVIKFRKEEWRYKIDPAMSMVMVLIILSTTIPLLKESAMILLQTVPTHIQVKHLQDKLLEKVDGVLAIHEFHVWQLAGNRIIASAHIRCQNLRDYMVVAERVKTFFHNEGIHSTTIQPEFIEDHVPHDDPLRHNLSACLIHGCSWEHCAMHRCCTECEEELQRMQEDLYTHSKHKQPLLCSKSAPIITGEGCCTGAAGSTSDSNFNTASKIHTNCHCSCKTPVFCLKCQMCGGAVHVEGASNDLPSYYQSCVQDQSTCTISFESEPSFSSITNNCMFESVT